MALAQELLDILVCPQCRGDLTHQHNPAALDCPKCRLRFPVRNDIPVMLIDEAEKLP